MEEELILKLLDVNENNKWITHDANSFFNWTVKNLSDNILTEEEYQAYQELQDISHEELKKQLLDIEYEFPGFFSITEKDVIEMEKEAAMLEEEINERNDRIIRMEEHERMELKAFARIEKEKIESDLEIKFMAEEIARKIEKLENLRKENSKKIESSNKQLLQPTSTFMYQMPHDKYLNSINKFCVNLDVFMKQNLNIRKMEEPDVESKIPALSNEKKKIIELESKILEEDLIFAGLEYAMENVEGFLKFFNSNILETNVTVGDWKHDEEIMKEQFEVASQELQLHVRQKSQSITLMDDHARKKHAQNIEILKKLNRAQILTDDVATIACALWTASKLDHKRLENRIDNSEEYENILHECRKRIGQLERQSKDDSKNSFNAATLHKLQELVSKNLSLSPDKLGTVEACVGEILSDQERLKVLTQSIVEQKYHARTVNLIKDINVQLVKLHPFVHKGPLLKPCLYDSSFFLEIHEKQKKKKDFEAQWQEIRSQFQKRDSIYKDDKFFRMKELLPIWFLSDPRKIILAIEDVKTMAANTGSSGFKALNITIAPMDMTKMN